MWEIATTSRRCTITPPRANGAGPEARVAGPLRKFLKHYRGHLQADAYVAYHAFFTQPERGMVEVGCWAHARRHFHNAMETDPFYMRTVLLFIAELYSVERAAHERGVSGEELSLLREHGSRPVLERLHVRTAPWVTSPRAGKLDRSSMKPVLRERPSPAGWFLRPAGAAVKALR